MCVCLLSMLCDPGVPLLLLSLCIQISFGLRPLVSKETSIKVNFLNFVYICTFLLVYDFAFYAYIVYLFSERWMALYTLSKYSDILAIHTS